MGSLIASVLNNPSAALDLELRQWDLLIRQGRRANLLARVASELDKRDLLRHVPDAPRLHLMSAMKMITQQNVAMRWEVECIRQALSSTGTPVVLLKGAAYLALGLPAAVGRAFSDVDILVPKDRIGLVESELMIHGWVGSHDDPYDQKYYREWMHEIPPMHHRQRGMTIDVHHSILPETARIKVNVERLFDGIQPLPGLDGLFVLPPADMVLHSATHLFHEGELEKGLRDLYDLDALFRGFGQTPDFWEKIVDRAGEVGVGRPLFYAIRYAKRLLGTPVPTSVVERCARFGPSAPVLRLMDWCYLRALQPDHASCRLPGSRLARSALFLRAHWIRMPLPILVYHLSRKSWMNFFGHLGTNPTEAVR